MFNKKEMKTTTLAVTLTLCLIHTYGGHAILHPEEVSTLKEIAKKLEKTGWNFDTDPCSGRGNWNKSQGEEKVISSNITCECSNASTNCHIIEIVLKGQNLSGAIPSEFVKLKKLAKLDLSRNCFTGSIPAEWVTMNLVQIVVMGNKLSGPFPSILTSISSLQTLHLEGNNFSGTIPDEIARLKALKDLILSSNEFKGNFPNAVFELVNLKNLRISDNGFRGRIPNMFGKLKKVDTLRIEGTSLEGPIPATIASLNLTDLRISDLKGNTSSNFPNLSNMEFIKTLVLRNCLLTGKIPAYLGSLKRLTILDLSFNKLRGEIPSTLSQLTKVDSMYLKRNQLSGQLPKWLLQKSRVNLDASENDFTWNGDGQAKCSQGSLNLVESCSILPNNINEEEPCLKRGFSCTSKQKYKSLFINCGGKWVTDADGNTYEADQESRGAATYSALQNWAFSSSGVFMDAKDSNDPYIKENTSILTAPNVPSSMQVIYTTARASPLSLTYYGLCLDNGNYTVSLHFAEIVFTNFSNNFTGLGRRVFDVFLQDNLVLKDFNIAQEAGGAATPIVKNFSVNVAANILRIHLFWAGRGTQGLPVRGNYGPLISAISVYSDFKPLSGNGRRRDIIIATSVTSAVVGICTCVFLCWAWARCSRDEEPDREGIETFTLKEMRRATNNFDPSRKIGEGGFGSVYRGELDDGRRVAVKKLSPDSKQGMVELLNEIKVVPELEHPNLVRLYGCCLRGKHKMLVYELMDRNDLSSALFGGNGSVLDWSKRYRIIEGIASGLHYLHEQRVLHRDIKANNVLLDQGFNAKISDFGLAEQLRPDDSIAFTSQTAGTLGYADPDHILYGVLSLKIDTYSFGVVVAETVTARRNTGYASDEFTSLLDHIQAALEARTQHELVDPALGSNYPSHEATFLLALALACTDRCQHRRPLMSRVLTALETRNLAHLQAH